MCYSYSAKSVYFTAQISFQCNLQHKSMVYTEWINATRNSMHCTVWIRTLYSGNQSSIQHKSKFCRVNQSGELWIKPLYSTNQSIVQLKSKHCAVWIKAWHSVNQSMTQCESKHDTVWIEVWHSVNQSMTQCESKYDTVWIKAWHSANHSTAQRKTIRQKRRNDWHATDFVQHNEIISSSSC